MADSKASGSTINGERAITADTALRLARYFEMSEAFWMGLQGDDDLEETRNRLGKRLETEASAHEAGCFSKPLTSLCPNNGAFDTDGLFTCG